MFWTVRYIESDLIQQKNSLFIKNHVWNAICHLEVKFINSIWILLVCLRKYFYVEISILYKWFFMIISYRFHSFLRNLYVNWFRLYHFTRCFFNSISDRSSLATLFLISSWIDMVPWYMISDGKGFPWILENRLPVHIFARKFTYQCSLMCLRR